MKAPKAKDSENLMLRAGLKCLCIGQLMINLVYRAVSAKYTSPGMKAVIDVYSAPAVITAATVISIVLAVAFWVPSWRVWGGVGHFVVSMLAAAVYFRYDVASALMFCLYAGLGGGILVITAVTHAE